MGSMLEAELSRLSRRPVGRRAFLQNGVLLLMTAPVLDAVFAEEADQPILKIGLVTDLHYADKPTAGSRFYRESLDKLTAAATELQQHDPAFIVELGDLIDAADTVSEEQGFLKRINRLYSQISDERHYVLGNHCVSTLTKNEFLGEVEREKSYYGFEKGGYHFLVLDACFRGDGQPYGRNNFEWTDANIPAEELEWLQAELQTTSKPVIVFTHQRLDLMNHYAVRNAVAVRKILENSKKVRAVFQGHSHENDYREIGGIHYCTLRAMVEGSGLDKSGCSLLSLAADGTIRVHGFQQQSNYRWTT
ncbi:MAG: alkaline phosphatase [Planctomycetaceae bacterium]|nr:alkaline phosphatase [Planctomycetaceae bacterium]